MAETLSTQTTITIVGVVLAYCTKALFENLSKYGDLNKKKDKEEDKSKDKNKDIGSCDEDVAG